MKEKFLRELADIQTGPFGSQLHKEDYVADGTPIVTVEHLGNKMFPNRICREYQIRIKID